jgi:hypothetical protein
LFDVPEYAAELTYQVCVVHKARSDALDDVVVCDAVRDHFWDCWVTEPEWLPLIVRVYTERRNEQSRDGLKRLTVVVDPVTERGS